MADFLNTGFGTFVLIAAQCLLIIAFVMISLLFLVYGDRKIWAAVQMRKGPNVVGVFGLLQSVADRAEIYRQRGGGACGRGTRPFSCWHPSCPLSLRLSHGP